MRGWPEPVFTTSLQWVVASHRLRGTLGAQLRPRDCAPSFSAPAPRQRSPLRRGRLCLGRGRGGLVRSFLLRGRPARKAHQRWRSDIHPSGVAPSQAAGPRCRAVRTHPRPARIGRSNAEDGFGAPCQRFNPDVASHISVLVSDHDLRGSGSPVTAYSPAKPSPGMCAQQGRTLLRRESARRQCQTTKWWKDVIFRELVGTAWYAR